MIFSVAGIVKMGWNRSHIGSPVPLGVDFRGGTQVDVQFCAAPDIDAIRKAIDDAGCNDCALRPRGEQRSADQPAGRNQRSALDTGRQQME